MADVFDKCEVFWKRMKKMSGDQFEPLLATFHRAFPITNCLPHFEWRGRRMLQVATNDYLGLATHPDVIAAAVEVAREHGAGTPLRRTPADRQHAVTSRAGRPLVRIPSDRIVSCV